MTARDPIPERLPSLAFRAACWHAVRDPVNRRGLRCAAGPGCIQMFINTALGRRSAFCRAPYGAVAALLACVTDGPGVL